MSDLAVSFTASRNLDDQGREVIINVLVTVPPAACYITGGCEGGDAFIGRWLFASRPFAEHMVIVPANRSRVDPWWEDSPGMRVTLLFMEPGSTYAGRNAELVEQGTMLVGFPAYPEDDPRSLRSGSWQTIRYARKAGKFCRWDCVKPPYAGWIEKHPSEFAGQAALREEGD